MAFVPGLELARRFYLEAVRPIVDEVAPGVPHSAARIGAGSEVLGFDSARSTDHDWGPRLQLFLGRDDLDRHGATIAGALADRLPREFLGHPTHFAASGSTVLGVPGWTDGAIRHGVELAEAGPWFVQRLGFDPADGPCLLDWLATPTQRFREVVAGAVWHDGLDVLERRRAAIAWYPHDVWLHVLACQWLRIAEEEPFVGRTAEAGDQLGSRVLAARLIRDAMRLGLLLRRRYPPYSKWLGTDFGAGATGDHLALAAGLVEEQNALGLTEQIDPSPRPFHDRPYQVIGADRCADALFALITDPRVARLPRIGAVDQFVDSTAALGDLTRLRALTAAATGLV